jgi:hypothetical protein
LLRKKSFETFFAAFVLAQCRHYEAKSVLDSVGYLLRNGTDVIILENVFAKKWQKIGVFLYKIQLVFAKSGS